jgi:hypothetical protein
MLTANQIAGRAVASLAKPKQWTRSIGHYEKVGHRLQYLDFRNPVGPKWSVFQ